LLQDNHLKGRSVKKYEHWMVHIKLWPVMVMSFRELANQRLNKVWLSKNHKMSVPRWSIKLQKPTDLLKVNCEELGLSNSQKELRLLLGLSFWPSLEILLGLYTIQNSTGVSSDLFFGGSGTHASLVQKCIHRHYWLCLDIGWCH